MVTAISVLGSTGSIGRQTVSAAEHLGLPVRAITANRNTRLLEEQARRLRPALAAVYDEQAAAQLRIALADTDIRVASGMEGLLEAALVAGADCVVTGVSGSVGLRPTLAAVDAGRRIALANKETLVCAGTLVMARARERGAEIIPVDSEHSAIFQCLAGRQPGELRRILLTASGGPFRGWTRAQTASVTPEQAVRHPNWSMGAKISVDSATMMNKGLEFIEAMHLFAVQPEQIHVLIHPQSAIHSMVELCDGAVIAQLASPSMDLPIQYALTWPERRPSQTPTLDFAALGGMTFFEPELSELPCLCLAMDCARRGGTAPAILSAANEAAVALFLQRKIGYNEIYDCVADALSRIEINQMPALEDILLADSAARKLVMERYT